MFVIGVTGGIGSGKSYVTEYLKKRYDSKVIDTDSIGHDLLKKESFAYRKVVLCFGKEILDETFEIDRKKLGNLVFKDPLLLKQLNEILHPLVEEEVDQRLENYAKEGVSFVCLESALLTDVGYEKKCNEVWYVFAEASIRRARLRENRQMAEKKINEIMKKQCSEEEFQAIADFVIDNSFGEDYTINQIKDRMMLIKGGRNA